jgi:hypothetical protein
MTDQMTAATNQMTAADQMTATDQLTVANLYVEI